MDREAIRALSLSLMLCDDFRQDISFRHIWACGQPPMWKTGAKSGWFGWAKGLILVANGVIG